MREFVGIDVSKAKLDICWLRNLETGTIKTKKMGNNAKGFEGLEEWLINTLKAKPQDVLVTIEPTNVYHEPLCYFLQSRGFKVFLVNPGKAKKYAQSLNLTHKTDEIDAFSLAKYGEAQKKDVTVWKPEADAIRELKLLLRRLTTLEKDRQRELNRLENYQLINVSEDVHTSSKEVIAELEKQIDVLTKKIDDHVDSDPELKRNRKLLKSVNGIGDVMSRELVCLFASKDFKNAKQVPAYLGLIPKLKESGILKGRTVLTKTGPGSLRAKLYMAAVSASRHNPDIQAQKKRLLAAGKTPMQALCAAMRKLVQICFGVVKHQSEYQPQVA